jgi:hypothetical protein
VKHPEPPAGPPRRARLHWTDPASGREQWILLDAHAEFLRALESDGWPIHARCDGVGGEPAAGHGAAQGGGEPTGRDARAPLRAT